MTAHPSAPAPELVPAPEGTDQNPERIRGMFSSISPAYDRLNHLLSGQLDRRWRRRAAAAAVGGLAPCLRLLDVATGTGDLARALAQASGGAEVHGADFTRAMLAQAGQKYGWKGFQWVEADGLRLPLPDAAYDAATIAFGLRNMADRQAGLAEMARVVRPGGRVVVLEFSQPPNRLVRVGYDFYSYTVLPRVGAWLSGSKAYLYLADSIREFWSADELARRMEAVGLTEVRYERLMLGVVCLHVGTKR